MARRGIEVHGLANLQRLLRIAEKDVRLGIRKELVAFAEPVRRSAEVNTVNAIPTIGEEWSRMRTGTTTRVVYVAPKQRGATGRRANVKRRRPNLKPLMMRPMIQALDQHAPELPDRFRRMLREVARKFSR